MITQNNLYLDKLDVKSLEENMIKDGCGTLQSHIDAGGADLNLSKSLYLNGEIIGGYLLCESDILISFKGCLKYTKKGIYTDMKIFVDRKFLNNYKHKKGIFSDYIYIDEKYRNKGYSKILIDYSKSLGDYVWGGSIPETTSKYWLEKQNRIKIFQIDVDGHTELFTSTLIKI